MTTAVGRRRSKWKAAPARKRRSQVPQPGAAPRPEPEERGAASPRAAAAAVAPAPYFVNAWVDHALVGGLSIVAFLALRALYVNDRTDAVFVASAVLVWIVNQPHFSATNYRLYGSRENIRQYPITALVIPFVVLGGIVASCASPSSFAPLFAKLFLVWSPYHFSGQTLGVSMLYARRHGVRVDRVMRYALWGFVFGTFMYTTGRAEAGIGDQDYHGLAIPVLGIAPWVVEVIRWYMWSCAAVLVACAVKWSIDNRKLIAPIVLLPAVTQYVWFVEGVHWASFYEFVPMFHGLQYLLIAWSLQLHEKLQVRSITPSWRYVRRETLRWGLINVAGGAALFALLPLAFLPFGVPFAFATAIVLAGVQIHHFFVDGVIWKLRNPRVASPLMGNISQVTGSAPRAGAAAR